MKTYLLRIATVVWLFALWLVPKRAAAVNDILNSPINLLVGETETDRLPYIDRLRSEGFQALFLSLTAGFSMVAATFAFVGLLYGAFLYVTSHGNEEQLTKAKQYITLTLIGLILLSLAYVIVLGIRDILYEQAA